VGGVTGNVGPGSGALPRLAQFGPLGSRALRAPRTARAQSDVPGGTTRSRELDDDRTWFADPREHQEREHGDSAPPQSPTKNEKPR
jgi:hypothetical protein